MEAPHIGAGVGQPGRRDQGRKGEEMTIEISMWLTGAAQYLGAIVLLLLAVLGVAFIIFLAGFRGFK
jgi:hypothetical protein